MPGKIPSRKDAAEKATLSPSEMSVGDVYEFEYAEWTGTDFRYTAYKRGIRGLVVDVGEDSVTVIRNGKQAEYNGSPDLVDHAEYEYEFTAAGDVTTPEGETFALKSAEFVYARDPVVVCFARGEVEN